MTKGYFPPELKKDISEVFDKVWITYHDRARLIEALANFEEKRPLDKSLTREDLERLLYLYHSIQKRPAVVRRFEELGWHVHKILQALHL